MTAPGSSIDRNAIDVAIEAVNERTAERGARRIAARWEAFWMIAAAVLLGQALSLAGYFLSHPWMTKTQVLFAVREWLIPLRWM